MPIYEYGCTKCGTFEVNQRITDPPLRRCPKCKAKVSKLISQTSFQLKGSGWYVTDYSSKDGSGKSEAKKDEKKPASTDSKPAAAPDSSSDSKSSASKAESTAA